MTPRLRPLPVRMPPAEPPCADAPIEPDSGRLARFLARSQPALVLLRGPARGVAIRLDQARVWIGRGPGVDLALDDPALGRLHVELRFCGDGFELVDLGSSSGTRVNGIPATRIALDPGDRVEIGSQRLEYVAEPRERRSGASPSGISDGPDGAGLDRDLAPAAG